MHGLRRGLRRVALFACFAGVTSGVLAGGFSWLKDARLGRPTVVFDYARMMSKRLPVLAEAARGEAYTVGFLGDSALVSYPEGRTVPERLATAVDALEPARPPQIHSLAMSGSGPFDYYFLADRIAAAQPDLVLISLNLDHLSQSWRGAYSRPQLAGLIAPGRLAEALRLPLYWTGLTTDQLLFRIGVVQSGGYDLWYWLTIRQAQVGRARERLARWLAGKPTRLPGAKDVPEALKSPEDLFDDAGKARTVERLFTGSDLHRYQLPGLLEHYAPAFEGADPTAPALAVLGATVRRFHEAGIATLVYLLPTDVEYMAALGALNETGLRTTIHAAEDAVVANGGEFLDLHDVFPTEAFRDAPGHLAYDGGLDGPEALAQRLAPLVVERARAEKRARRGN